MGKTHLQIVMGKTHLQIEIPSIVMASLVHDRSLLTCFSLYMQLSLVRPSVIVFCVEAINSATCVHVCTLCGRTLPWSIMSVLIINFP